MKFNFLDLVKLVKSNKILFFIVFIISFIIFSLKLSPIKSLITESKLHVVIRELKYINLSNEVVDFVQGKINAINFNQSRPDETLDVKNYPKFLETVGNNEELFKSFIQLPPRKEYAAETGFSFAFYKLRHSVCKDELLLDQILRVSFAAPYTISREELTAEFFEIYSEIAAKYLINEIDTLIAINNIVLGIFFEPPNDFEADDFGDDIKSLQLKNPYASMLRLNEQDFNLSDSEYNTAVELIEATKVLVFENKAFGVMKVFNHFLNNSNLESSTKNKLLARIEEQTYNYQILRESKQGEDIYSISVSRHPWKALAFCFIFALIFSFGLTALWEIIKLYRIK